MKTESVWQTFTAGDPLSISESNKQNSCNKRFTFDLQRKKFEYIDKIGDYIENRIPTFKDIWPLLGVYTINEHWDNRIDENLEIIGIAHYTILKSLSYISNNRENVTMNDPQQKYKNIIFHYALIIDCIKQISFHILKFQQKLDSNPSFMSKKLSFFKFMFKAKKYYTEYYKDQFNSYLASGVQVSMRIHSDNDFISKLVQNRSKLRSFEDFKSIIYPIRNTFIHGPSIDIYFNTKSGYKAVTKGIKKSSTMQGISASDPKNSENPIKFMDELFEKSTLMLSDIWSIFYNELEKINYHAHFGEKKYRYKF